MQNLALLGVFIYILYDIKILAEKPAAGELAAGLKSSSRRK
jgi:hypothetical protein